MLFSNTYVTSIDKLEKLQKRLVRMIDGEDKFAHTAPIFKKLKIIRLREYSSRFETLDRLIIFMNYLLISYIALTRQDGLDRDFGIPSWVLAFQ